MKTRGIIIRLGRIIKNGQKKKKDSFISCLSVIQTDFRVERIGENVKLVDF